MKSKKYNKNNNIDITKSLIAPKLCNQYFITPQEAIFVAAYTKEWNEIDALKESGLYPQGTTVKEARQVANNLFNKSGIAVAIQQASQYRVERMLASKDMIIAHLTRIAKADMNDALNEDGTIKEMKDIPYSLRCCISKIKSKTTYKKDTEGNMVFNGYITELELESHTAALKELARLLMPQAAINVNLDNSVTQNNMNLSHLDTKEKVDNFLELLTGETKNANILELEKIEECNLDQ